jgi:hypothetical protein
MCVLCLWELTQRDSAAEVILAVIIFLSMTATLGWAALKVIRLAKRSMVMHKNPAYILYSDPKCLNRWGFLYIQYRATAYYFIIPVLGYILLKTIFIAFAQGAPIVQAIALLIIEAGFLIGVSVLRPWMDKKTNVFNISIAAVNFLNVIFLLFFTAIFGQPTLVTGVMGVIFFVYNAVFALILLLLVLVASVYAILSKNPDTRYQPMRDDRGSFIKSNSQLTAELDALGQTARGDVKASDAATRVEEDKGSLSSGSLMRPQTDASNTNLTPLNANNTGYRPDGSRGPSPVENQPLFPAADESSRRGTPVSQDRHGMYNQGYNSNNGYGQQGYSRGPSRSRQPYEDGAGYSRSEQGYPQQHQHQNYRQQNDSSPWQRGAGYDR